MESCRSSLTSCPQSETGKRLPSNWTESNMRTVRILYLMCTGNTCRCVDRSLSVCTMVFEHVRLCVVCVLCFCPFRPTLPVAACSRYYMASNIQLQDLTMHLHDIRCRSFTQIFTVESQVTMNSLGRVIITGITLHRYCHHVVQASNQRTN